MKKSKKTPYVVAKEDISSDERYHFRYRRIVDTGKLIEVQFSFDGKAWVQGHAAFSGAPGVLATFEE